MRTRRLSSRINVLSTQHLQNFRTLQSASLLRSDSSLFSAKSIPDAPPKEPATQTMGLILKAYDDCRQDTLALQVMRLLQIIWEAEGIDIPLMVYNVTPARTSTQDKVMGGIIECVGFRRAAFDLQVPNSDSRDNLGKKGFTTLKSYYEVSPGVSSHVVALRPRGRREIRDGAAQIHSKLGGVRGGLLHSVGQRPP